jgi:hypothetical protein
VAVEVASFITWHIPATLGSSRRAGIPADSSAAIGERYQGLSQTGPAAHLKQLVAQLIADRREVAGRLSSASPSARSPAGIIAIVCRAHDCHPAPCRPVVGFGSPLRR